MRGLRLAGFLLGLVGVGVLAGVHPQGGWWGVAGTLAVVVASVSYAVGSLWGQRLIANTSGLVLSASFDARRPARAAPVRAGAAAVGTCPAGRRSAR